MQTLDQIKSSALREFDGALENRFPFMGPLLREQHVKLLKDEFFSYLSLAYEAGVEEALIKEKERIEEIVMDMFFTWKKPDAQPEFKTVDEAQSWYDLNNFKASKTIQHIVERIMNYHLPTPVVKEGRKEKDEKDI